MSLKKFKKYNIIRLRVLFDVLILDVFDLLVTQTSRCISMWLFSLTYFMWDFLKIIFDIKHNLRHEIWCFKNVVYQTFVLQASQRCKTFSLMKFLVSLLVNKSYVRLTQEFLVFYLLMVKEPKHIISPANTSYSFIEENLCCHY